MQAKVEVLLLGVTTNTQTEMHNISRLPRRLVLGKLGDSQLCF